ncbi:kinase-like domain-containing protein [Rhizophagus diaphanus]|nr:kinase-like domain-containing protein [Rhizophagus diaphanus] [Rhizophagus sp. MUCL 43196]
MSENYNEIFIIDLGLCKPMNSDLQDSNNEVTEHWGVVPYMAPEILRNKPYTPASDIYSFSMIMWEFTSGIPPFYGEDELISKICQGDRPKIDENTPQCYIDLMKKCWDSDPSSRPNITTLNDIITKWIECINCYYEINREGKRIFEVPNINKKLKNDMREFVEANNALTQAEENLTQEEANLTQEANLIQENVHSQTYSASSTNSVICENYIQEESQEIKHI